LPVSDRKFLAYTHTHTLLTSFVFFQAVDFVINRIIL